MTNPARLFRALIALALAACLACPPALALVTLNDGHDHIYVTGTFGFTHDSNIFASSGSTGDTVYNASLSAEYNRHAGWISVNASTQIASARFGKTKGQNFDDPNLSVELEKKTGRTTGSLTLQAARESRADPALNTRASSWNYASGLNFHYHIVGAYDLSGQLGYTRRDYVNNPLFSNLATYSSSFDLFHVLTGERDVSLGYRYRYSQTSRDTASADHGVNLGLYGRIIRGINGSLRVGFQERVPEGKTSGQRSYASWTAGGSLAYPINKKLNVTGQISKDFSTTATDSSVDALAASMDVQYAFNSRLSLSGSIGWNESRFIGDGGRLVVSAGPPPILGAGRRDDSLNAGISTGYTFSEHLKVSFGYTWFENWSNATFADFVRSTWTAGMSSHW